MDKRFPCHYCHRSFNSNREKKQHISNAHQTLDDFLFRQTESAFKNSVVKFSTNFGPGVMPVMEQLEPTLKKEVVKLISHQVNLKKTLKYYMIVHCKFIQNDELGNVMDEIIIPLTARNKGIIPGQLGTLGRSVSAMFADLGKRSVDFVASGSNWVLEEVTQLDVNLSKTKLVGGCGFSDLSHWLSKANMKHIVDASSGNHDCFFASVAYGLVKKDLKGDESWEQVKTIVGQYVKNILKTKRVPMPTQVKHVRKFEKIFKHLDFGVNVFIVTADEGLQPMHLTIHPKSAQIINLLMVPAKDTEDNDKEADVRGTMFHYVYMSNPEKLMGNFSPNKKSWNPQFSCTNCSLRFSSAKAMTRHYELCSVNETQRVKVPWRGSKIGFQSPQKTVLSNIVGFVDFEASLRPFTREQNGLKFNCEACKTGEDEELCSHRTKIISEHIPTTYSMVFTDLEGEILFERTESSETDLMAKFYTTLEEAEELLAPLLNAVPNIDQVDMSQHEHEHDSATVCYICGEEFGNVWGKTTKVRDHDHSSGEYLGPAHNLCNLSRRRDSNITIFVHNLMNYDAQFLLKHIEHYEGSAMIKALPYNTEKFRTLTVGKFVFTDSCQLLPASLDELVQDLVKSDHNFPLVDKLFPDLGPGEKDLLLRKGIYPYEFAESLEKLKNATTIPAREDFYNQLQIRHVKEEDYQHALKVFEVFKCDNMLDYTNLYCMLDTILLGEVMSVFRSMIHQEFKLDCTKYISTPQLAYDCMLRTLEEDVELMTDADMILMMEQNIRGGVSFINERSVGVAKDYAEPTEACPDPEDKVQDHILYIDANNLYGFAQLAPLPRSRFRWLKEDKFSKLVKLLPSMTEDQETGFILEVDLEYPPNLHAAHDSLPLAPEKVTIFRDDVSPFSQGKSCLLFVKGLQTFALFN